MDLSKIFIGNSYGSVIIINNRGNELCGNSGLQTGDM